MTEIDLTTAIEARVANQEVDILRIANQLVWEKPAEDAPTWTIFNEAPLTVSAFMDSPSGSWCGCHFERYAGPELEITHVGIYIPAGAGSIGYSSGAVGVQFTNTDFVSPASYTNVMQSATDEPLAVPLVAGWNWTAFSVPWSWPDTLPHMMAGYGLNAHYVYSAAAPGTGAIASTGSNFEMCAVSTTGFRRSWYSASGAAFSGTSARTYGIDVRVREA
jgi:hypothetical protein